MFALLTAKFVQARRDQIRGYGYDEFSVFAELLQNAEDAYVQREQLGMEPGLPREISYRYVSQDGATPVLEIEHKGRPFNYSQHGARHFPNFSKDVEGVLRSAGSFKPHSLNRDAERPNGETIGRFGLGFKCVYLLTDRPEIHSGDWHFAIEAGCLPKELARPDNLPEEVTRIRLPLRDDAAEVKDVSRFVGLVPFLRMITRLEIYASNGESTTIVATPSNLKVLMARWSSRSKSLLQQRYAEGLCE
jgi:HSP90 family molecular chaperone